MNFTQFLTSSSKWISTLEYPTKDTQLSYNKFTNRLKSEKQTQQHIGSYLKLQARSNRSEASQKQKIEKELETTQLRGLRNNSPRNSKQRGNANETSTPRDYRDRSPKRSRTKTSVTECPSSNPPEIFWQKQGKYHSFLKS